MPSFNAALSTRGYTTLTPVQQAVLEPGLDGSDLLVSAQTGSGKTVAFGLALAPTLLGDDASLGRVAAPMALVIAPTRELALQVMRELEWLYAPSGGTVVSCVGGMDMRTERKALSRNPHIVVGTPGRLKDHIERGSFDTSQLKAVVLDEADEMLDMGFREELQYILDTSPKERRTLMFSATLAKGIVSMAKRYQKDAKRITTKGEAQQHVDIEYNVFSIAPSDRENAIINLLRFYDAKSTIIFCGTRMEVSRLTSRLTNRGFSVVSLSGELSQAQRSQALQSLRDGRASVCVATDVASRGIDLPGLGLVIHADIPKNRDILLHRSGRTGRAGSKGISALLVPHNMRNRTDRLLQNAKLNATWMKPPSIKDILKRDHERFLADPVFHEAMTEDEKPGVTELLERFPAEQLAAALMRLHNTKKPAPEELLDAAPQAEHQKPNRDAFKNSVWVSLSVGHNMSAEARWILPMMCGAGNITKKNIGAIKIQQHETYVELTSDCADRFFKEVGASGKMEKNIIATRMEHAPNISGDAPKTPGRAKPRKPKTGFGEKPKEGFKKKYGEYQPHDRDFSGDKKSNSASKKKSKGAFKGKPKSGKKTFQKAAPSKK